MRITPLALTLLVGCDPNFTVTRGDLGPFRIAGMGVIEGDGGAWIASASVYSGEGLYHELSPTLAWTLDGEALGEGYDVVVPGPGLLGLAATSPEGEVLIGEVTAAAPPPALTVARYAVTLDDLSLEARRAATATEVDDAVADGQAARLILQAQQESIAGYTGSWMLCEGRGTALELDDASVDLLAEEVTWDDGVVEAREPVDPGLFHALALLRDGAGGNAWSWVDAAIGIEGPLLRHEGRLLPLSQADGADAAERARAAGWALATLEASGDEAGVALVEVTASPEVDGGPDLSGQDSVACAPEGQPFRLAWLAEGRCALSDLIGARVLLEVW